MNLQGGIQETKFYLSRIWKLKLIELANILARLTYFVKSGNCLERGGADFFLSGEVSTRWGLKALWKL